MQSRFLSFTIINKPFFSHLIIWCYTASYISTSKWSRKQRLKPSSGHVSHFSVAVKNFSWKCLSKEGMLLVSMRYIWMIQVRWSDQERSLEKKKKQQVFVPLAIKQKCFWRTCFTLIPQPLHFLVRSLKPFLDNIMTLFSGAVSMEAEIINN